MMLSKSISGIILSLT